MFGKILFATSASPACDNAAKVAFELARRNEARLYVFHVLGVPTRGFGHYVRDLKSGEEEVADADYREWVTEELKQVYEAQFKEFGPPNAALQLAVGVPHTEILRFARQEGVDLIVMGAHGREEDAASSRVRSIIGNTMQKVAKSARCPVLIVNRPCNTSKPADAAFQFAYRTAREVGAKLYLFHACDLGGTGLYPSQAEIERQLERARKQMQDKYVSKMTDYDNYQVEIWEGTPYVEILKYARDRKADLIVMAHHAKDVPSEEAEIGSTVEQVVLRSACPVASVTHAEKVA